jgi:hypothetical protein
MRFDVREQQGQRLVGGAAFGDRAIECGEEEAAIAEPGEGIGLTFRAQIDDLAAKLRNFLRHRLQLSLQSRVFLRGSARGLHQRIDDGADVGAIDGARQPLRGAGEVPRKVAGGVLRDLDRRQDLIDLAGDAHADPVGLGLHPAGGDVGVVKLLDVAGGQCSVAGRAAVHGRGQEAAVAGGVFEPERIAAWVGRLAERADLAERGPRDRDGVVILLLGLVHRLSAKTGRNPLASGQSLQCDDLSQ